MTTEPSPGTSPAFEVGLKHHQAGELPEAEAIYRRILAADPRHFNALHLLGVIAQQRGEPRQAVDLIERAIEQDASAYPAHNNLGLAYRSLGELDAARSSFERALAIAPDFTDAQSNLALVLHGLGRLDEAVAQFRRVLASQPDAAAVLQGLGSALMDQGQLDDAAACFQRVLELDPDDADARFSLARVFEAQGRKAEALAAYQDAVLWRPEFAEAHFCLGMMLQDQGLIDDACECFRAALASKPDFVEAMWALAMSQLAVVHGEGDSPESFRRAFSDAIADLDRWFDGARARDGYKAVGTRQPFYLAYHLQNNRDLLSQYGDLCARLMKHWQDANGLAFRRGAAGDAVRVGIVSAHIHDQSVWTAIVKGWCRHLDTRRLSVSIFSLGARQDRETAFARASAAEFVDGPKSLREWVDAILARHLDVIVYPEVGMDSMTAKLASMRLCPVQMVAWGHPETTGLPTIDYYLSAADFEPAEAQQNYRERLVALPHLGCCYQALDVAAVDVDLGALGIAPGLPVFLCPGTPFKYAPEHDWIFVEIARRLGGCKFIFFSHQLENLSEKLQQRLDSVFTQNDMYFDEYALFLPWLNRPAFYGLMRKADVYLDTIGFSGFNTAMQAIECGLPIVSREGTFMRGRLGSGILRRMGMSELVTDSEDDYVDLAVQLVQDPAYRDSIRERIEAARHVLFDDVAPVRALEEFLISAARAA